MQRRKSTELHNFGKYSKWEFWIFFKIYFEIKTALRTLFVTWLIEIRATGMSNFGPSVNRKQLAKGFQGCFIIIFSWKIYFFTLKRWDERETKFSSDSEIFSMSPDQKFRQIFSDNMQFLPFSWYRNNSLTISKIWSRIKKNIFTISLKFVAVSNNQQFTTRFRSHLAILL